LIFIINTLESELHWIGTKSMALRGNLQRHAYFFDRVGGWMGIISGITV